jgi:hypothetical protein
MHARFMHHHSINIVGDSQSSVYSKTISWLFFYIVRANDSVGNFRDNHLAISNFQHGSNKGFVLEENITQHFKMGSFGILVEDHKWASPFSPFANV